MSLIYVLIVLIILVFTFYILVLLEAKGVVVNKRNALGLFYFFGLGLYLLGLFKFLLENLLLELFVTQLAIT